VLVIDDNLEEVAGLIEALRGMGVAVGYAASGEEALAMARAEPPDVILCDLRMPGMNGHEFLEAVSTDPDLPRIGVILLDNEWVLDPNAVNCWSKPTPSGRTADCHFNKPVRLPEMARDVATFLERVLRRPA
jgi:CheY-like chemotaxis protein